MDRQIRQAAVPQLFQGGVGLLLDKPPKREASGLVEFESSTAEFARGFVTALFDTPAPRFADLKPFGDGPGFLTPVICLQHAIFQSLSVSHP